MSRLFVIRKPAGFAKSLLSVGAAVTAFIDPSRGDMVALLSELTSDDRLRQIRNRMIQSTQGQQILREKPRVRSYTLLQDDRKQNIIYPSGSFGEKYISYLRYHDFSPDERDDYMFEQDDLSYILLRYREIHDYLHVLTDLPTSVLGEITLKWFEMLQTGLPLTSLSAIIGSARLTWAQKHILLSTYIPWAVRASRNCDFVLSVRYEDMLHLPLSEVQRKLDIHPAPHGPDRSPKEM
jgi:ubiquinone biosynthesis protein COQ4